MIFTEKATVLEDCIPLNINQLFKFGYFDWYRNRKGIISKPSEELEIIFETCLTNEAKYIHLIYKEVCSESRKLIDLDYKIHIVSIPSNLGKGEVFYLECPESKKRARVLYKAPDALKFIHREAYKERINYACQNASKNDYATDRYWSIMKKKEELEKSIKLDQYNGKETRKVERLKRLTNKADHHLTKMFSNRLI